MSAAQPSCVSQGRVVALLVLALLLGCAGVGAPHAKASAAAATVDQALAADAAPDRDSAPKTPLCRARNQIAAIPTHSAPVAVAAPVATVALPASDQRSGVPADEVTFPPKVRRAMLQVFQN